LEEKNIILYVDTKFLSPYAMSVFVTLVEKNIPFEIKQIDLVAKENYHSDYAAQSLTCRVPTLAHGNFYLSESSAISEYLEETFRLPEHVQVYPKDRYLKSRARQIQAWLRSDLLPIREERSTEVVFVKPTKKPLSITAQESTEKLFRTAKLLLKDNALNLFNEWCIADTDLAIMLSRLVKNGDKVPDQLLDYFHHQWQRPSVQQWISKPRSL